MQRQAQRLTRGGGRAAMTCRRPRTCLAAGRERPRIALRRIDRLSQAGANFQRHGRASPAEGPVQNAAHSGDRWAKALAPPSARRSNRRHGRTLAAHPGRAVDRAVDRAIAQGDAHAIRHSAQAEACRSLAASGNDAPFKALNLSRGACPSPSVRCGRARGSIRARRTA